MQYFALLQFISHESEFSAFFLGEKLLAPFFSEKFNHLDSLPENITYVGKKKSLYDKSETECSYNGGFPPVKGMF